MTFTLPTIRRVAVIGAGPGGLVSAKQLKEEGVFEKVTVFDRNEQIGGTWIYSSQTNQNPPLPSVNALQVDPPCNSPQNESPPSLPRFNRLTSAIYSGLHTNLPTSVMKYRDFDFPTGTPFFPSHTHVLEYLQLFAKAHNLLPLIQLNTNVIEADYDDNKKEWTLTLQKKDQSIYTDTFDAVIVSTGHYSIPHIPALPGIEFLEVSDKVTWSHSRDYRLPNEFKDQTVLVVGSGSSGLDIVREVSQVAKKVYHCVRSDNKQSKQAHAMDAINVERVGLVKQILSGGGIECDIVVGGDHQTEQPTTPSSKVIAVDHVVFATGYLYSFPFFPFERDNLIVDGQSVQHLYEFLFYINNPTLAFIGLPIRIVPFPLSQTQATLIARCWNPENSAVTVPTTSFMQAAYERQYQHSGNITHQAFVLNIESEFSYVDRLSAWSEGYQPHDKHDNDEDDDVKAYESTLKVWQSTSTDPITQPLPEEWKQQRVDALLLRKQYLGY